MDIPWKHRILFMLIGFVLGVPTSYFGYIWMSGKLAKQEANCISDIYQADFSTEAETNKAIAQFDKCRKSIDPKKGTIPFVRDEIKRAGH